jgi:XTP/dITP diphosphohydrolase
MTLIFATNNKHKLQEVQKLLPSAINLVTLADAGIHEDIPETADTLEGNASIKSRFVFELTDLNCFADDTGLEVEALNGAPGVYSARYAGEKCSFADNVNKLLHEMQDKDNRAAKFRTVISLMLDEKEYFFEGVVDGEITREVHGTDGFGYDPIFKPAGFDKTFAEMTLEEKNKISHRARAVEKLVAFLSSLKETKKTF